MAPEELQLVLELTSRLGGGLLTTVALGVLYWLHNRNGSAGVSQWNRMLSAMEDHHKHQHATLRENVDLTKKLWDAHNVRDANDQVYSWHLTPQMKHALLDNPRRQDAQDQAMTKLIEINGEAVTQLKEMNRKIVGPETMTNIVRRATTAAIKLESGSGG